MSVRAIVLLALLPAGLAWALAPAEPAKGPDAGDSGRDLVYWGAGGPVRVHLQLQIAGRSAEAAWSEAIDALFAFCDRNGDGVLDASEYAPFVEPRGRQQQVVPDVPGSSGLRLNFDQRKARVSRPMFESALREAGFEPVSLVIRQAQPNSRRLSTILFRRLDRDGDGLSLEVLRDARERLAFFDANEDELIAVAELLGNVDANANVPPAMQPTDSEDATDATADLTLLPGQCEAAVRQVFSSRGDAKRKLIRRAEFGGDPKTFSILDKNGDGRLDASELEAWLRQPAPFELCLRTEGGSGRRELSLFVPGSPSAQPTVHREFGGGANNRSSPRVSFDFRSTGPVRSSESTSLPEIEVIRGALKKLADAKGLIQRKQVESSPRQPGSFDALAFFDFADRNADGKVEAAEVDAALKVLAPFYAGCRIVITVEDQGTGLFELLDRNSDGQLSPRELVEAGQVLKPFADSAGKISPGSLPRRFFVRAAVETIPVISVPIPSPAPVSKAPADREPAWFFQMDRNGDGDVSLREFLGPIEMFRKLDKNGDGLISLEEARAARLDK